MARTDIIDNWSTTPRTGTFTYDNLENIGYTYVTERADYSTRGGLDNTARIFGATESHQNEASILFDQPIEGVTIAITAIEGLRYAEKEEIQFTIDGEVVNLHDLLDSGDLTIAGTRGSSGASVLNAAGNLADAVDPGEDVYLTFHGAHQRFAVEGISPTGVSGSVFMDVFLDTTGPYPSAVAPCFTTGTLIDTDRGQVAVEDLNVGDMVRTMDHGFQPIRWIGGSRVFDAPVRIQAGTFGNARDLIVSPRHRMLLQGWQIGLLFNHDEAFATAYDLKNGTSIAQEPEGWGEYFHVLFDTHEVIFAEGAATESFFPDEASLNGMAKATRDELAQTVDLTTYGKTARPTLTANQAMYVGHNLDMLEDEQPQIQAAQ